MPKIQIEHRASGTVLFRAEATSLKRAVELAVKARANLTGANLTDAYLEGTKNVPVISETPDHASVAREYRARHPDVPVIVDLDAKILAAIETGGGVLDMRNWHTCATTHCRAGWAIHLAGEAGYALERRYGPECAAVMIYRASTGRVPNFFATTDEALEDIRRCAGEGDTHA